MDYFKTKNDYEVAIFKVDNSLHITIKSERAHTDIRTLLTEKELKLLLFNAYTKQFGELPTVWHERVIQKPLDNNDKIIILILK